MSPDTPRPQRREEAGRSLPGAAAPVALLLLAATLRLCHAVDLPLGADEVGVGVLQASGQAADYLERLPAGIVPIEELRGFVAHSDDFGASDVLHSLRHAGMHPPIYYLVVHGVLRFLGNDPLLLRALSILFSLASIAAGYALAAALWDRRTAGWAALFLAVSAYGVKFGVVVRPYPLMTLLSLTLGAQAVALCRVKELAGEHRRLALFSLTTWAGLFSLYHFAFVAASLWALVIAHHLRDRRALAALAVGAGAVTAASLPWLPALADQLAVVTASPYYFYGDLDPRSALAAVTRHNFGGPAWPTALTPLLAISAAGAMAVGAFASLRNPRSRGFVLAFAGYLAVYSAVDVALDMKTLSFPAMLFWIVPVSLLLLSAGLASLPVPSAVRTALLAATAGVLLLPSAHLATRPGPEGLPEQIEALLLAGDGGSLDQAAVRSLVLYNTRQRRFLFPLVHAISAPCDFLLLDLAAIRRDGFALPPRRDYDQILVVNDFVWDEPATTIALADLQRIRKGLAERGYRPGAREDVGRSSVLVFRRH